MMSNKLTTPPATEPVTAAEMDAHLRGDGALEAADSELIESLVVSAREYVELFTRRALITQTWTLYLDTGPLLGGNIGWWDGVREGSLSQGAAGFVELPIGPLLSVTSVKTFNTDNEEAAFANTNYFLDRNSVPGRLVLNTGSAWPVVTRNTNGIEIVYTAGYGPLATDVPSPLRTAIKQLATHWYENREVVKTQSDQNQAMAPLHVQSILNRYQVKKL